MARYGSGVTDNDFSSRYAEAAMRPDPLAQSVMNQVLGSVFGSGRSARQEALDMAAKVDDRLRKEAAKGDSSIVGYVSGYGTKVAKMQDLLQTDLRNYETARKIFRDLQDTASANGDPLNDVIAAANVGGNVAHAFAEDAKKLKKGDYQNAPVTIGGRQFTLGQLFKADGANPLEDFGISPEAANAYLGEDEGPAPGVGVFVTPRLATGDAGAVRQPFNAGLLNEASAFVAGGDVYDRMRKAFGSANVVPVLTDIRNRWGDIGGMNHAMKTVLSYAEARRRQNPDNPDTGASAARSFMSVVDRVAQDVFFDPSKNRVPEQLSPSERRWALEAATAVLGATTESGVEFDFSDKRVRAAVESAAAAMNLARSSGYNLHDEVKASGGDVGEEFKRHIRAFLDNDGYEPSTFVSRERDARDALRSRISIAPPIGATPTVMTGASGGYDGDAASRTTGRVHASSAVSVLEKRIEGAVMRELSKGIHDGKKLGFAVRSALMDTSRGGGRERLLGSVASEFYRALPGPGGRVLVDSVLVPVFENTLNATSTTPFEMHRILEDIATKEGGSQYLKGMSEDEASAVIGAASRWYRVNVPQDVQMRRYRKMLVDHLTDGRYNDPINADLATLRADTIIQQGLELLGNTDDAKTFDTYIRGFTDRGVEFVPVPAVVKKGTTEQVRWDRREPGTGRPVFAPEDAALYEVSRDHYEQFILPTGENAGNRIFAIPIRNVNELRARPNPAWEADNEANRMTYEQQKRYLADPSRYIIKE